MVNRNLYIFITNLIQLSPDQVKLIELISRPIVISLKRFDGKKEA